MQMKDYLYGNKNVSVDVTGRKELEWKINFLQDRGEKGEFCEVELVVRHQDSYLDQLELKRNSSI